MVLEESRKKLTGPLTQSTLQKLLHGEHHWPVKKRPFWQGLKLTLINFVIIIITFIIIIILVITLVQGIDTYIIETNRVSRVQSVATVRYLQFMLHVMLFHMSNKFCTCRIALP